MAASGSVSRRQPAKPAKTYGRCRSAVPKAYAINMLQAQFTPSLLSTALEGLETPAQADCTADRGMRRFVGTGERSLKNTRGGQTRFGVSPSFVPALSGCDSTTSRVLILIFIALRPIFVRSVFTPLRTADSVGNILGDTDIRQSGGTARETGRLDHGLTIV